jgi:hypothetical protein
MKARTAHCGMPYSGCYRRSLPPEDAELTHIEPGTPGGEHLRRFWQPVVMVEELDGGPLALRIMGEDLVLFRDLGGQMGFAD